MKRIVLLLAIVLLSISCLQAQTWGEWFKQKKTQLKYLGEQIAALKVYGDYVKKGYNIAHGGLETINKFKRGEFDLHNKYFNSLAEVSPTVRRYVKIAQAIELQKEIITIYQECYRETRKSKWHYGNDVEYVGSVFGNVLNLCSSTLDGLITVATSGKLELTERERISRIDILYEDMQRHYTFARQFSEEVRMIGKSRMQESDDAKIVTKMIKE
jgi:hypothetical protein